jgi:hypothetical protein
MKGAALRSFFSTLPVSAEAEPPSEQQVAVKLLFPLKTGEVKTYATGVDIEYRLPLESVQEIGVEVGPQQYFLHYPNKSDYIRHATMTIESTSLNLTSGQFATRKSGRVTESQPILTQPQCPPTACGRNVWHPVVTASAENLLPGADLGLRVTWS